MAKRNCPEVEMEGEGEVDVEIPTIDGRLLILPRYTEPEAEQLMVLEKLGLSLPGQPPPRIRVGQVDLPATKEASV